jgi:hypothetical protein
VKMSTYSSLMTAASCLSLIGDAYIIASFWLIDNLRHKIYSKLIYFIAFSDFIAAFGTVFGEQPSGSGLCIFQSVTSTAFHLSAIFWTLVLTQILYKIVVNGQSTKIMMLFTPQTVAVYSVFILFALMPLFSNQLGHIVDSLPGRCFISYTQNGSRSLHAFGGTGLPDQDDYIIFSPKMLSAPTSYPTSAPTSPSVPLASSSFGLRTAGSGYPVSVSILLHVTDYVSWFAQSALRIRTSKGLAEYGQGYFSNNGVDDDGKGSSSDHTSKSYGYVHFSYSSLFWIMLSYYVWIWGAFIWISYSFISMTFRIRGLFGPNEQRNRDLQALVGRQFDKCWPFPFILCICWLLPSVVDIYAAAYGEVINMNLAYVAGLLPIFHGFFSACVFYWCNKRMLRSEWKKVLGFTLWAVNGRKIAVTDAYAIVVDLFMPRRERGPEEEAHSMSDIVISAFDINNAANGNFNADHHEADQPGHVEHLGDTPHGNPSAPRRCHLPISASHPPPSTMVERYGGPLSISHTEYVERNHSVTHGTHHAPTVASTTSRCPRNNNASVFSGAVSHSEFYPQSMHSELDGDV